MELQDLRANILVSYGANSVEVAELLAYNKNVFDYSCLSKAINFPLASEAHVNTWKSYASEATSKGVFQTLKEKLVQLRFPISPGISQTSAYQAATRKGIVADCIDKNPGLLLRAPEKLQLRIHPSIAGEIPVIITDNRLDFVSLVQALTMRNEPKDIPASMGACMVGGFNNWDRIHQYRQEWQANNPNSTETDWNIEFRQLIPRKQLYQDRFIILSQSCYSNVSAEKLGLSATEWQNLSLTIRLEHECTHYLTKRLFGSMRNNLLDEFIADYRGIVSAAGNYRDDWFLNFMGLESFPNYRQGGRLENYRNNLSETSFEILQKLVYNASRNLKSFETEQVNKIDGAIMLAALCQLTLEELASDDIAAKIHQAISRIQQDKICIS
ncbi:hypothetical protein Riv7116_6272 [Rivularia sp. PCC 7116]|uniref:DUF7005 family protein n=1 Tax=Rivularia sp. PCC 7116 TaxID=373994 RepID=UPI00029EE162|nr:hypothetical protein [Rivularia sp. PCC 7116]AFY58621.1 hypothetical protein Riv7116_6272 [Rivularia sp. PCC 7116]